MGGSKKVEIVLYRAAIINLINLYKPSSTFRKISNHKPQIHMPPSKKRKLRAVISQ
jgi:hypothetical protein